MGWAGGCGGCSVSYDGQKRLSEGRGIGRGRNIPKVRPGAAGDQA